MTERRRRSAPRIDGRRETDPRLTTAYCAEQLDVSRQFIVGEIRDGRLRALVMKRGDRSMYRISPAAWTAYLQEHWKHYPVTSTTASV